MTKFIRKRLKNLQRRAKPQPEVSAVFLCPKFTPTGLWSGGPLNVIPVRPEIRGAAPLAVLNLPATLLGGLTLRNTKEAYHG